MTPSPSRRDTLPNALRKLRKERGWSQEALAHEIGTTRFRVIEWEKGRSHPDNGYRQKLTALGVSAEALGRPEVAREVERRLDEIEGEMSALRALVQGWS